MSMGAGVDSLLGPGQVPGHLPVLRIVSGAAPSMMDPNYVASHSATEPNCPQVHHLHGKHL